MSPTITTAQSANGPDFPWGRIRWLCNQEIDSNAEMTFGVVYINPDDANPLHYHPNCEEIIFLLSGRCEHRLGDEWFTLETGSMLRIPRGVAHCARNAGWDPVTMVIAYSSPDRQTVFLE